MHICHPHTLNRPAAERRFGIRLTLPPGDTLTRLLGKDWEAFRWFETTAERDRALLQLQSRHSYSRPGDFPIYVLEKVSRDTVS